jgi:hypothetical protein
MVPYARDDYNLTLCLLQSRLRQMDHGQPYARVDFIPQLGTKNLASGVLYLVVLEHGENYIVRLNSEIWIKITDNIFHGVFDPEQLWAQEGSGTS